MPLDDEMLSLAREMAAMAEMLDRLAGDTSPVAEEIDGAIARNLAAELRRRRRRNRIFGDTVFRDPVWDMLVALYEARLGGKRSFVSEICIASGVPPTTALRHLDRLIEAGWIEKAPAADDRRKTMLALTPQGLERMERYFRESS